ncbi:hypothetical protein [Polaribacter staleyi]|uniref:energy transducer TonB n=1 Tax=Polaribacter staleyi TaxID=2022337 RepID=UPI0031BA1960
MNSKLKITIPKPCHENWNKMTQKEKGKFCSSCSKTVIDFTKKTTSEITDYLIKNKKKRVCGHFYKKQLNSITIEIPKVVFDQHLSFQKLFVLSLFFVMGTTLFSCQYTDGKKQKIQDVVIIDTINNIKKETNSLENILKEDTIIVTKKETLPHSPATTRITVCNTNLKNDKPIEIVTTGEVVEELKIDGVIEFNEIEEEEIIMGFIIEQSPKFKESEENTQKNFEKRIKIFFEENFNTKPSQKLDLKKGKHQIYTEFIVDKKGYVTDIKAKSSNRKLEKEVIKTLKKLPQLIPGKQADKIVKTKYNLPISIIID